MPQEKKENGEFDDNAFEELEKDFLETLTELKGEKGLEKFRMEYEKLHKVLRKSHESEKRLMNKCRELNAEIITNSAKVATALKLSQEDQNTIASLKKEIEKTWKMVDAAHEKETRARETIQSLRQEVENLSRLVEHGAGLTLGQEHNLNELLKIKVDLTKERDEHLAEISSLREQLSEADTKRAELEQLKADADDQVQKLTQDLQVRSNELQRELRKKDKLERQLKACKANLDDCKFDIKTLTAEIEKAQTDVKNKETVIIEQKMLNERILSDAQVCSLQCTKLQADLAAHARLLKNMDKENITLTSQLRGLEGDLSTLKTETQNQSKARDAIQKKLRQVEEQKAEIERERDTLRVQMAGLEKEIDTSKKQTESDKKATEDLKHERDLLSKHLLNANGATQKQQHLAKLHEKSKKHLEQEIQSYKEEAQKQRKIIYQLEKERDRYINEASELTQKVLLHMEDVKMRELQLFDYKKKIAEAETKLKQEHNLYEAVRADRNLYSKNLIECQDEIVENKRKLKVLHRQMSQLKEEIQVRQDALVKEQMDRLQTEKEKETLKEELQRVKKLAAESKAFVEAQEVESRKLRQIITRADAERLRQRRELDQVVTERDILGTQLVRRNDELSLLYEKLKLQQSVLSKGEIQYNQRLEDIRVLKLEIRKTYRQRVILQKSTAKTDELKREVFQTERELLKERTRCKALEEEIVNPLNIHRWRTLKGIDPPVFELIQKLHMLQKRLIIKTEEVVEKELLIQEKEKLYLDMKHILARQPGPEVAEQLQIYKQTLKEKTKQMKALASELNMQESQVGEYKYEIERISMEMLGLKKKYFMQKKKEQQQRERERAAEGKPAILSHKPDLPRFTGGGFSLQINSA